MDKTVYKSRVGWETALILAVLLVPQIVLAFFEPVSIYGMLVLIVVTLWVVFTLFKTMYTVDDESLNVKSGVFYNKTIRIKSIRKIAETRSPLSAPAASLDRLEVYFNRFDSVMISPKEKKAFVNHLQKINPDIEFVPRKKS
ncbi:hypothetical protein AM493_09855 [Flavobacterium akiainvivens]|uniref:Uncharacterized protein YyaB-like PH domain-containing protein n=1 Tax=Flavobacterium akiainvivens TaxID=1202724 RepID=A0A0M8M9G0_9FLAO|nr:PH domain-containing protein [Flavobacterium akiainvivens]KOS06303.1 hypothetical protein AM493_09855 [Flavobacterium akiainvivens]SFQ16793.1 PH domain-containing protein [Flavobacterium akiainvivens]